MTDTHNLTVNPALLAETRLGRDLEEDERSTLAGIMAMQDLVDGERLASEGDSDRRLVVLVCGRLRVSHVAQGGEEETVHLLQPGECAGTGAFVEGLDRLATLTAEGESTVLTLTPEAFEALIEAHPRLVFKVMRALFQARHENLLESVRENEQLTNYISKVHGRY